MLRATLLSSLALAGVALHVPADYPTIQEALDAAGDGDEVVVAAGTHFDVDASIVFPPRAITLRTATGDPSSSILDGTMLASGSILTVDGDAAGTRTIEGFTFRRGPAALGMDSAAETGRVRLVRNRFEENGPASCVRANALDVEIVDNEFTGNQSYLFGALVLGGNAVVTGNVFTNNHAIPFETIVLTQGGGVYLVGLNFRQGLTAEIRDNHFEGNTCTDYGGGINVGAWMGRVSITGNTFLENEAGACAGGVYQFGGSTKITVEDNLFVGNVSPEGAAIGLEELEDAIVRGNTLVGNGAGAALKLNSTIGVAVERNLVAFNGGPGIMFEGAIGTALTCNDAYGNAGDDFPRVGRGGGMNVSVDPLLCDAAGGDYSLAANSPCLPGGNACGVRIGAFGPGCDATPHRETTWGAIKARFRPR